MFRLYEKYLLPRLVHHACGIGPVERQRRKVVPLAEGDVLEIGFGSGLNLPHYDPGKVRRLWGLEPAEEMWDLAEERLREAPVAVERLLAGAEEIALPDDSVDTVVVTYTLCTVPDVAGALRETARVLRPGGRLRFCEHGAAPDPWVHRFQRALNPVWKRLAGGCHLTRPIVTLLEEAGFRVGERASLYLPGFRPATYNVWGAASPPAGLSGS